MDDYQFFFRFYFYTATVAASFILLFSPYFCLMSPSLLPTVEIADGKQET
jgi:hypothetical protein